MAIIGLALPQWSSLAGIALLATAALVLVYVLNEITRVPYPPGVDFVGQPPGRRRFSLRTRLAYYLDCPSLFREAYENYSKKGKAVIIPGILFRHEIILPPRSLKWVSAQPESVLSSMHGVEDLDQTKYSLGDNRWILDSWQGAIVKTEMNAALQNIAATMNDELQWALDGLFGTDTERWKELDVYETMKLAVAQAASRFIVGLPLCRDQKYVDDCIKMADACVLNAGLTGGSPRLARPLVGFFAGAYGRLLLTRIRRHFAPLFRERLALIQKYAKDDPSHQEPRDQLQMMMRYAQAERPEELDLDVMTPRLCVANFGAMHQTSMLAANVLLDVLGSDAEFGTMAALRDEAIRILDGEGWTKAKVVKMARADSVARETLRLRSYGWRSHFRMVMRDGVRTDAGVELPKGSVVSIMMLPAQLNEDEFEEPLKFDPFRFSRIRESSAAAAEGDKGPNLSFIATSPSHLSFGHGRHSCPGRFLVDFEIKMLLAYILEKYDIKFPDEYGGKRPENRWVAEAMLLPSKASIMVRRRRKGGEGKA